MMKMLVKVTVLVDTTTLVVNPGPVRLSVGLDKVTWIVPTQVEEK